MEEEFLGYLKEWKTAVENENELNADEKRRMLLSRETMEGLEITGTCTCTCIVNIIVYVHVHVHSL